MEASPPNLRVLHILNDGPDELAERVIAVHARAHHVRVIDLSKGDVPYERLVDEIFAHDRVISW